MKNIILFAVITVLIIACSKDETPPVINTFSLELNDTIRNTFAIDLDASDKSGVNRIELYINDTLVDEGNAIPYSYKWNTLKVDDGKHLVKLVVFDTEGNKTEKSTEVYVNNCLLMISSYNLSGPFDLVVTDEEGNVLGRQAFDVFMKRTVKPDKEFDGEAINVLMVTGSIYKSLSAWIHVKRGSEFVLGGTPVNETYKSIKLHIKNDISSFTNLRICTDHESVELKSIEDTVKIPQNFKYRSGSKMLFQLSTTAGKFYRIADLIETSAEMTINLSSITKAMEHVVITPPSPGMVTAIMYAAAKSTDIYGSYYIFSGWLPTPVDLWYPKEFFARYSTTMGYFPQGSSTFYVDEYNGSVPAKFIHLDADIQITNPSIRNFTANFTGTYDLAAILYRNADRSISCRVKMPASKKSWKLPDMGTVFNDSRFNSENFMPSSATLDNFESIDFSKGYFDVSISTDELHLTDPHSQQKQIMVP